MVTLVGQHCHVAMFVQQKVLLRISMTKKKNWETLLLFSALTNALLKLITEETE